jgi:signal transduction histidine kinase
VSKILSPEARALLRFIRWHGAILAAALLMQGVDILLPSFSVSPTLFAATWLFTAALVVDGTLALRAHQLTLQERLESAVKWSSAGHLVAAVAIAVLFPGILIAVVALLALLPVVIAVPIASRGLLVRLIALSTGVTVVGSAGVLFEWLSYPELPPEMFSVFTALSVPLILALCALLIWQSHERLQGKNRALAESERSLERKVAERTAELEQKNEELEDSQLQLAEASRAKSAFLASMSHELRTPLNAVIGYSEMVQEEAQDSGRLDLVPDLEKILSSGRYLLSLINDVLDLSKIEAGKMEVFLETFDVASLIDGVATTIEPLIHKNANALETQRTDALGTIHASSEPGRGSRFAVRLPGQAPSPDPAS